MSRAQTFGHSGDWNCEQDSDGLEGTPASFGLDASSIFSSDEAAPATLNLRRGPGRVTVRHGF